MMKVLHIVPTYLPAYNRGGPIWSVHNLNKWLVKKGADVTVYTTNLDVEDEVETGREVIIDGVKVHYFKKSFPRIWQYWRVGFLPAFLPRHWEYSRDLHIALAQSIKDFDVVHVTSTFLFASTLGTYYAKKHDIPSIVSPRGNLMEPLELRGALKKKLYIKLVEKKNLERASAIHFTVPQEERWYRSHKLPLNRSVMIPNGIDVSEFNAPSPKTSFRKKWNIPSDVKVILFLSRISWKKGLDTLIPAYARVLEQYPKTRLIIAGGDEEGYKRKIMPPIRRHDLERRIVFTGMITGDEKAAALEESDMFVLSSYSENFSMATVEAMYFKLPVVITEQVGVAGEVKKAGAGIVTEKDENKFAESMLEVLSKEEKARKMGEAGHNVVKETFSMERISDKWMRAYKNLGNISSV